MEEGGSENGKYGRFQNHPQLDQALAALGARQHAVVGLDQLRSMGFTATAIQKRSHTGRLHRIHRGVYAVVPGKLLSRDGLYMAAVLACGSGAVLSHRSAAALHGLRPFGATKIDVTVPGRAQRHHAGVTLHRSTTLAAADATVVDNIPCTTVARTLFDLAEVISRRPVERAFDQAEVMKVFDLRAIDDQLRRNPTRLSAATVKAILKEHYIGSTLTRSDLEEAMLAVARAAGVANPEVNAWVDLDDGEPAICADFVWRAQRVVVEADGRQFHRTHQAVERDQRRDQRLTTAGWRCVRTSKRQIQWRALEVQATVVALLKQ